MSKVTIEIDIDNAAFSGEDLGPEVARILIVAANRIENSSRDDLENLGSITLRDINGSHVGNVDFEIDDDGGDDEDEDDEETRRSEAMDFVISMTTEDLRVTLEELCGCQCYDSEAREIWVDALVENIVDETTSIDDVKEHFKGKY